MHSNSRIIGRKPTNFGGISTVIVMALVIAASIAIAVYFIAYFIGLSSSVAGTAQAMPVLNTFSMGAFDLTVKNTGTVAIKSVNITIVNSTNKVAAYIYVDCSKHPVGNGATLSIACSTGQACSATVSGGATCNVTASSNTWPPSSLIEGKVYRIVVNITYMNGKTQIKDLGTYTLT